MSDTFLHSYHLIRARLPSASIELQNLGVGSFGSLEVEGFFEFGKAIKVRELCEIEKLW